MCADRLWIYTRPSYGVGAPFYAGHSAHTILCALLSLLDTSLISVNAVSCRLLAVALRSLKLRRTDPFRLELAWLMLQGMDWAAASVISSGERIQGSRGRFVGAKKAVAVGFLDRGLRPAARS